MRDPGQAYQGSEGGDEVTYEGVYVWLSDSDPRTRKYSFWIITLFSVSVGQSQEH